MRIKTLADGFQWQLLTLKQALKAYEDKEVYILYPDGSEALAESLDDIKDCHSDCQLGTELGFSNTNQPINKYNVKVLQKISVYVDVEVEAINEEEARKLAEENAFDGGYDEEFACKQMDGDCSSDFEIFEAELITNNQANAN